MSAMQVDSYSVEVIGFSEAEKLLLSSAFGLFSRRSPRFFQQEAGLELPNVFLVDANNTAAINRFHERNKSGNISTIFIGDSSCGTSWPFLVRPIRWLKLLQALEQAMALPSVDARPKAVVDFDVTSPSLVGSPVSAPSIAPTPAPAPAPAPAPQVTSAPPVAPARPATSAPSVTSTPPVAPARPVSAPAGVPASVRTAAIQPEIFIAKAESTARPTPSAGQYEKPQADSVLVVDDNVTVREFMKSKLASFNFNVDYAESGEEAIGLTGQKYYACIFLDVIMPGIDGYQVCKLIKSKRAAPKTAVIMLTSKDSPFDKIRGSMSGCDAYLTKPVDEEKLLETIVKYLPNRT